MLRINNLAEKLLLIIFLHPLQQYVISIYKIKVASATVVVTLRLHINTNKIDHVLVLNVYIFMKVIHELIQYAKFHFDWLPPY